MDPTELMGVAAAAFVIDAGIQAELPRAVVLTLLSILEEHPGPLPAVLVLAGEASPIACLTVSPDDELVAGLTGSFDVAIRMVPGELLAARA